MGRKSKPYIEFLQYESYPSNPYEVTGIGTAFIRENSLRPVFSEDGSPIKVKTGIGEFQAGVKSLGRQVMIDRRPYVKVFDEVIDHILTFGMGVPGYRLLFYVFRKLEKGSDRIKIVPSMAKAVTGYKSDKSIYEGLNELIKLGLLAKVEGAKHHFFINPQMIFRGKRDGLIKTANPRHTH